MEQLIGPDAMRHHERIIMLSVIDQQWKDHLLSMDHLREGIGLRGYGQHDPLVEYKRESFDMFEAMMSRFEEETVRYLYLMQVIEAPSRPAPQTVTLAGDFDGEAVGAFAPILGVSLEPPLRWMTWKRHFSGGSGASWSRRVWQAQASKLQFSRSFAARKWVATIRARAAAGKNTKNAAEHKNANIGYSPTLVASRCSSGFGLTVENRTLSRAIVSPATRNCLAASSQPYSRFG